MCISKAALHVKHLIIFKLIPQISDEKVPPGSSISVSLVLIQQMITKELLRASSTVWYLHGLAPLIDSALSSLWDQPQGHTGTGHKSQATLHSSQFICV